MDSRRKRQGRDSVNDTVEEQPQAVKKEKKETPSPSLDSPLATQAASGLGNLRNRFPMTIPPPPGPRVLRDRFTGVNQLGSVDSEDSESRARMFNLSSNPPADNSMASMLAVIVKQNEEILERITKLEKKTEAVFERLTKNAESRPGPSKAEADAEVENPSHAELEAPAGTFGISGKRDTIQSKAARLWTEGPQKCATLAKAFIHKFVVARNVFLSDNELFGLFDAFLLELQGKLSLDVSRLHVGKSKGNDHIELAKALEHFQKADRFVLHKAVARKRDNLLSTLGGNFKKGFFSRMIRYFPKEFVDTFKTFQSLPSDSSSKADSDDQLAWFNVNAQLLTNFASIILEKGPRRVFGTETWSRFCNSMYDSDIERDVLEKEVSTGYVEAWGLLYILEALKGNFKIHRKSTMNARTLVPLYIQICRVVSEDKRWAEDQKRLENSDKDVPQVDENVGVEDIIENKSESLDVPTNPDGSLKF